MLVLQIVWSRVSSTKSIPFIHEYPEHGQKKSLFIDYEDAFDFDFLFSF